MTDTQPPTVTVHIRNHHGENLLDMTAMALLFGVTVAEINALPSADGALTLPAKWLRQGRRRANEAKAHTGSDELFDALRYWARKDHGADLVVVRES